MKKHFCNIPIIALLILSSCLSVETSYPEYSVYLILNESYNLSSKSCEISMIDMFDSQKLYLVVFKKVRGGYSKTLLSEKRYKVHDGHKGNRLNVYKNEVPINSFSVNDFKSLNLDTINLNILLD